MYDSGRAKTPKQTPKSTRHLLCAPPEKTSSSSVDHPHDQKKPDNEFSDGAPSLKAKLREKDKLIITQQKDIQELRKELDTKDELYVDLAERNSVVQTEVIEKFQLLFGIVRDLKQANINTAHPDSSTLAVGYEDRPNFMVHVGRDHRIPKQEWTHAFSLTCPRDFTRHFAFHLFGLETLRKSTLTGEPSNRSKNEDVERKKPKSDGEMVA
ncbi:hypothetical protein QAD02_007813 [Eretmocerus hayati]|uniref:Uncharacterized protein n=1 Tax=Eretmocerus hayati TaxID=131215 RepID=A0ACC2N5I3_9HYME|nr:hypothetical protein QAD02_007813 [Eretmocerus hayati]